MADRVLVTTTINKEVKWLRLVSPLSTVEIKASPMKPGMAFYFMSVFADLRYNAMKYDENDSKWILIGRISIIIMQEKTL